MSIAFIEDGMELSKIREIINALIQQVNQWETPTNSYYDLKDRPAINGVELTDKTTVEELNLTLSQFSNLHEIENLVAEIGERVAKDTVQLELAAKLDSDINKLPDLKYNFDQQMVLTVNNGKDNFKATIYDLLLYLKYLILQDTTFGKAVPEP